MMKKKISISLMLIFVLCTLCMTGCGENAKQEQSPYEGKWTSVSAQMMGMSVGVEEVLGGAFSFEVKNNGKVNVLIGEDEGNGKWSAQDNQFTLTIEGEDMVGAVSYTHLTLPTIRLV